MSLFYYVFIPYFIIMNLVAVLVTVYDKYAAKNGKWRIKEATLLILAALSGCVFEYITMKLIHHKTKKLKFMAGIPAIFLFEVVITILIVYIKVING